MNTSLEVKIDDVKQGQNLEAEARGIKLRPISQG